MLQCPICQQELQGRTIQEVRVEACPQGHGTWFDDTQLNSAKDATDPNLDWMDFEIWKHPEKFGFSQAPRLCPRDNVAMVTVEYGHTQVQVDFCPQCRGVWLDQNEFEKLIQSLEDELAGMTSSEYIRASVGEAREVLSGEDNLATGWTDLLTITRLFQYRTLVERPALTKVVEFLNRTGLGLSGYFPP